MRSLSCRGGATLRCALAEGRSRVDKPAPSFLARHEFLIRRLHSLLGLVPVGAFMCVHLIVNASVLESVDDVPEQRLQDPRPGRIVAARRVGVHLPAAHLPRRSRHRDHPRRFAEHGQLPLRRELSLHAPAGDRPDCICLHLLARLPHARLDSCRLVARRAWRSRSAGPSSGPTTPPRPPARHCRASSSSSSTPSASCPAYSIWPTASGPPASPGAFGPAPVPRRRAWRICAVFGLLLAVVGMGALFGMRNAGTPNLGSEFTKIARTCLTKQRIDLGDIKRDPHKTSHSEASD